ncbi:MAG: respiratory nitrate reductase subunit gamma, partial [Propionibacteriaceae bacterium]|nr:respiratory nitrate reductase subunit gamma [Propionibacteriaceae bacterium]
MNALDILLWGVVPYLVALTLIAGLIWRYRYDQFGWTTRSSQLYESRLLRIASPLFHFGLLMVLGGHLLGLLVPKAWTDLVITQETYHLIALSAGTLAGVATLVGIALLIYRRRTTGPVFLATTRNDKLMYVILTAAIVFGLIATLTGDHTPTGEHHNYRETVSIWFRSLLVFQPDVEAMAAATWQFKVHILIGLTLFALVPFSRLVHAFTVPLHYLF